MSASNTASIVKTSLRPSKFWNINQSISSSILWTSSVISLVLPLVIWLLVSRYSAIDSIFLPSPGDVVAAIGNLWSKGYLLTDIKSSFLRVSSGFILSAIVAVPLGILMGTFASIRALCEPIVGILRYMPAPAFIPLLIIYLGIDEAPKIALIFIGTVFFNILMIMDSVKFVPQDL
ncbi:MAG: ABC transporter permease, partial [Cyanobacteria bacterium P01_C01_bin.72]